MKNTVYNACDLLSSNSAKDLLAGRKLGLVTNVSGVTKDLQRTVVVLAQNYHLQALFSPEHGLGAVAQAGGFDSHVFVDSDTNVAVYDIFGKQDGLQKAEQTVSELDAVLFDIQDIGTRYYTYQYTMLDAMQLCKKANIPFIVLDRINPLGGIRVEGSCLHTDCLSEIGRVAGQPVISGMTTGELALWYNQYLQIDADVKVLHCEGLKREFTFDDTDLLFVPPSPNMPTIDTVFLYGGMCLFEGTNLSEGRGTTKPFEMFGAPWLEPKKVIDALYALPNEAKESFGGLLFRPCSFVPTFSDYEGEVCNGLQMHIRNKNAVDIFATGLYLLSVIRELYPNDCVFSPELPNLVGSKAILQKDFDVAAYLKTEKENIRDFYVNRKEFLLY